MVKSANTFTDEDLARVIEEVANLSEEEEDRSGFTTKEFAKALEIGKGAALKVLARLKEEGKIESGLLLRRYDVHGKRTRVPGWWLVRKEDAP